MIQGIKTQISNINSSLEWIKKNRPTDYEQKFLQLVEERRQLKRLEIADEDNPAIAVYGGYQVGKTYLTNSILRKNDDTFKIKADGKSYKFIEEINPPMDYHQTTGIVTRFTSFSKTPGKYCEKYPILMKCLSVADIILILSNGYYNYIYDYVTTYSEAEITELAERLYNKYRNMPTIAASAITPDCVMDMKEYFRKHIEYAREVLHSSFFERISLVADKIPADDWVEVFSVLWHKNQHLTKLFKKMLDTLAKLRFQKYVYLPVQAILHERISENTVMSVQCLYELLSESPRFFTDAYIKCDGSFDKVANLTKSEICAVCAEIIIKIDEEYLENTNRFSFCNITDTRVQAALSNGRTRKEHKNEVTGETEVSYETSINVLKENDMLDFPSGGHLAKKEALVTLQEDPFLISVLRRSKVAYLFNMYNEAMLINILLYCHHFAQNAEYDMPLLLNSWIMNYVGNTMEKRRKTLELTDGISPLFYIGTKFNIDMERKAEEISNSTNALSGRWQQRFEKVLYHQCFNADGSLDAQQKKIFLNWTQEGECFNNSYILRDFKFSGELASRLYKDENTDNKSMLIPEEHYRNLRETFCSSEHVRRFFKFPELSWDVCASIDNDGAQYIISQLAKVASKMGLTREEQFKSKLAKVERTVLSIIEKYHI
ncbi:MAG: hypothetical protein IJC92_04225 [Bacteroidaceae bacterium]|nr:hypothetical protein [Bacteroidaceae bacterium]